MAAWMFFWSTIGLLGVSPTPTDESMRKHYHQGVQAFNQTQYGKAQTSFRALLPWLEKTQSQRSRNTRAWHLLTLGQCDVLYYLAQIAQQQKRNRKACQHYQTLVARIRTVPEGWKTWNVYPNLPAHMTTASEQWNQFCPNVPSLLQLKLTPSTANIERRINGAWTPVTNSRIELGETSLTLRISAPNYESKTLENVSVSRWQETSLVIALKKKETPTIVAVRPPIEKRATPPPVPVYKQWWFWTVVGVGVVGVAGATVGIVLAQPSRFQIQGPNGGPPQIFK